MMTTGGALVAVILAVGPVSGAHLNPVVTVVDALFGGVGRVELAAYVAAQLAGAVAGVTVANLMYSLPAVTVSEPPAAATANCSARRWRLSACCW